MHIVQRKGARYSITCSHSKAIGLVSYIRMYNAYIDHRYVCMMRIYGITCLPLKAIGLVSTMSLSLSLCWSLCLSLCLSLALSLAESESVSVCA